MSIKSKPIYRITSRKIYVRNKSLAVSFNEDLSEDMISKLKEDSRIEIACEYEIYISHVVSYTDHNVGVTDEFVVELDPRSSRGLENRLTFDRKSIWGVWLLRFESNPFPLLRSNEEKGMSVADRELIALHSSYGLSG